MPSMPSMPTQQHVHLGKATHPAQTPPIQHMLIQLLARLHPLLLPQHATVPPRTPVVLPAPRVATTPTTPMPCLLRTKQPLLRHTQRTSTLSRAKQTLLLMYHTQHKLYHAKQTFLRMHHTQRKLCDANLALPFQARCRLSRSRGAASQGWPPTLPSWPLRQETFQRPPRLHGYAIPHHCEDSTARATYIRNTTVCSLPDHTGRILSHTVPWCGFYYTFISVLLFSACSEFARHVFLPPLGL